MPRTDRSVTFLTGMIIAALYVILLLGFSRETYVLRGLPADAIKPARNAPLMLAASPQQSCAVERPVCSVALPDRSCANAVGLLRQMASETPTPTLDKIQDAASAVGDLE